MLHAIIPHIVFNASSKVEIANCTKSPTQPLGFLAETQKGEKGVDNGIQRAYYATIPTGKITVKEES